MSDAASLQGVAARRAQSYFLLSRLVHKQPTADLLGELAAAPVPTQMEEALAADWVELRQAAARGAGDPEQLTNLAVEFTRLFGGLSERDGAPPIESVARERKLLGDATAAVSAAYAEAGFPEPLPEAGPPDHLATELRFLALCCYEEAEARRHGDTGAALAWLERERAFLDEHMLTWAPAYCAALATRAAGSYFAALARLVAEACTLDREDVAAILRDANRATPAARR